MIPVPWPFCKSAVESTPTLLMLNTLSLPLYLRVSRVVKPGVLEYMSEVNDEVTRGRVLFLLKLGFRSGEIHWLLDKLQVVLHVWFIN